jgi:hypothetical protein
MNSPPGIFTNFIPMAFFSAPVWAIEDICGTRQVTTIANVPTKTTLIVSLHNFALEHVSKPVKCQPICPVRFYNL